MPLSDLTDQCNVGLVNDRDQPRLLIAGIDPGLASGAMVVIDHHDRERVLKTVSLVENKTQRQAAIAEAAQLADRLSGWSDREFVAATLRAERWINSFERALTDVENEYGQVDYFAIESFVDQRSRAREEQQRLIKNRWHTPLVMGLLLATLTNHGATAGNGRVVYQNAGIVIRQLADEITRLKQRKGVSDILVPGDHVVRNDHQRKALAHALALSLRLRVRQP